MPTILDAVEEVRQQELRLNAEKRRVGKMFRVQRKALGLTLESVGRKVRLSIGQVHNIENGKAWKFKTVLRFAKLFDRLAA